MERVVPFLNDLMKKNYNLINFQTETNPERLNLLATANKDLAHDLSERLAKAAPQLRDKVNA
jgi:hypothetical protein